MSYQKPSWKAAHEKKVSEIEAEIVECDKRNAEARRNLENLQKRFDESKISVSQSPLYIAVAVFSIFFFYYLFGGV
jgi:hypothetical protein